MHKTHGPECCCNYCDPAETTYKLYYHVDESVNAYLDGEYDWERANARMKVLLHYFPSVTLDGTRYWAESKR